MTSDIAKPGEQASIAVRIAAWLRNGVVCALVAGLLPAAGNASDASPCPKDQAGGIPLAVCIEATGEAFRGRSFGKDGGPFCVESRDGIVCRGTWRRLPSGLGAASFSCSDGRSGTSVYTWFERSTGTAVGDGSLADGSVARFWSGNNLARYFREVDPSEAGRMACKIKEMLLSRAEPSIARAFNASATRQRP